MSSSTSDDCLAALLADLVQLNRLVSDRQWPRARHSTRMAVVRAGAAGLPRVRSAALELLAELDGAIRPAPGACESLLTRLNHAMDDAMEHLG